MIKPTTNDMKTVVFDAVTPYQLLTASILCQNYYKKDKTVLLLNTTHFQAIEQLVLRLTEAKIFSQIVLVSDGRDTPDTIAKADNLLTEGIDIFHFSSFSSAGSCHLYNKLMGSAKISITEEGAATYNLFEHYEHYLKFYKNPYASMVDLTKADEILVFNKALYMSDYQEKVQEIIFDTDFNLTDFVEKINIVFDYQFTPLPSQAIFFSQNFLDYGVVLRQDYCDFIERLVEIFGTSLAVKPHPMDKAIDIYEAYGLSLLPQSVPWEVIVLNHLVENKTLNKILLSIGSTSLISESLLLKHFECDFKNILLFELFATPFNDVSRKFYKRAAKAVDFCYDAPISYEALARLV